MPLLSSRRVDLISRPQTLEMDTIYSIGHSNQPLESFLLLLGRARIQILADVRSQPVSRFSPQFNRKALEKASEAAAIRYVFLGEELGGRPQNPALIDGDGRVLYGRLAETPPFQSGLRRLHLLLKEGPTAIMCSEEDPVGCHRRLLIGRVLDECGVKMVHLRRSGSEQPEATFGRDLQPPLGQDPDRAWRSVRPVRKVGLGN